MFELVKRSLQIAIASGVFLACGTALVIAGYPPEATRKSAPDGIEERALAVKQKAPPIELTSQTKKAWRLEDVPKEKKVVLVFYRGDW